MKKLPHPSTFPPKHKAVAPDLDDLVALAEVWTDVDNAMSMLSHRWGREKALGYLAATREKLDAAIRRLEGRP